MTFDVVIDVVHIDGAETEEFSKGNRLTPVNMGALISLAFERATTTFPDERGQLALRVTVFANEEA